MSIVKLTWTDNSSEMGFSIERGTNGITYTEIGQVAASVTTYTDTTPIVGNTYYYRVRGFNGNIYTDYVSGNITIIANDWYLPSMDELDEMYAVLKDNGLGSFVDDWYWTSTQDTVDPTMAALIDFTNGSHNESHKINAARVRACRSFTSTNSYTLGAAGQYGGLVFYKSGNNYIEAAPSDQSNMHAWSNITASCVGTSSAIGTGSANTNLIIVQVGHTDSAAQLCKNTIIP